jgi:hypothetical protein
MKWLMYYIAICLLGLRNVTIPSGRAVSWGMAFFTGVTIVCGSDVMHRLWRFRNSRFFSGWCCWPHAQPQPGASETTLCLARVATYVLTLQPE